MVLPDYYDYINILAFKYLYKYENKKSISIETLHLYRKKLIEIVLDEYKEKKNIHFSEEDQWEGEVSFTPIQEKEKIKEFLNTYEDYFYLDKNMIILKEEVTYAQIEQLEIDLQEENKIPHRLTVGEYEVELLQLLGIHTIENILRAYAKIETKIEEKYNELYTQKSNSILRKEITDLLQQRTLFSLKIFLMPEQVIEAFFNISGCITFEKERHVDYRNLPIDNDLYKAKGYYDENNFYSDIEDRIYDIYQYAIFGENINVLFPKKIVELLDEIRDMKLNNEEMPQFDVTTDYIDDLLNENFMQPLEENKARTNLNKESTKNEKPILYFFNSSEEEWIFNLSYLDKLNKYMKKYGENESLLLTKRRLLYALDQPRKKIFIEENFEKELANLDFDEIDEESFEFFQDEYFFLADEVFETKEDENTVKKLLLISTYYDLTKNEEIVDIINEHKDHEAYDKYCEIIFGEEKGKRIVKQR